MTNINKIIAIQVRSTNYDDTSILSFFSYHIYDDNNSLFGLAIDNSDLRFELMNYHVVNTCDLKNIYNYMPIDVSNSILTYVGYNLDINSILDLILDANVDEDRKFYLKSILYYKTNQEGKELLKYNLKVKHFDDLVHYYAEDFSSYKVINNNDDFSESEIILETYLTKNELKNKFKDYLNE